MYAFCNMPLPNIDRWDEQFWGPRIWQMSHGFLVLCSNLLHSSFLQLFITGRAEILWLEL